MPSHIEETQMDLYAMGILSGDLLPAVEEHLLACPTCQSRLVETDGFLRVFRPAVTQVEPSPVPLWAKILQARSAQRFPPVVHTDNKASGRYTILDIVTGNALGLLYRISRVISQHGCDVDLVLIATEGEKAIDVFHITKARAKLTEAEQTALTSDLQRTLEGTV